MLTENTKVRVYQACVISTLLCVSETWVTYAKQKKRLNSFHIRCLRCLLNITWKEHTANKDVFQRVDIPNMFALLSKRHIHWLGHVCCMEDGRIPKDAFFGEPASGARYVDRPALRFRNACKRNIKSTQISIEFKESDATERNHWRQVVPSGVRKARRKKKRTLDEEEREKPSTTTPLHQTVYTCTSVAETVTQKPDFLVTADAVQNTDVTYGTAPLS